MSAVHGKTTVFKIDGTAGGALVDVSSYTDTVTGLPGGRPLEDVTAFGDTGERQTPGMPGTEFTTAGHWDSATTAGAIKPVLQSHRLATQTASFEYGPEGSGTGAVKYSGECWLKDFKVEAKVKGRVDWTATWVVDNGVTTGTF